MSGIILYLCALFEITTMCNAQINLTIKIRFGREENEENSIKVTENGKV